jgi:hypothetical protein
MMTEACCKKFNFYESDCRIRLVPCISLSPLFQSHQAPKAPAQQQHSKTTAPTIQIQVLLLFGCSGAGVKGVSFMIYSPQFKIDVPRE